MLVGRTHCSTAPCTLHTGILDKLPRPQLAPALLAHETQRLMCKLAQVKSMAAAGLALAMLNETHRSSMAVVGTFAWYAPG